MTRLLVKPFRSSQAPPSIMIRACEPRFSSERQDGTLFGRDQNDFDGSN